MVVPTIAVSGETGDVDEKAKPPPMFTTIPINGVPAKSLLDTGSSDDFVGNHFVTTNRVSVRRREKPLSIQQAVRGSKPKSNATATVDMQFGEWTRRRKAHIAGLAGYDAIIGVPTLTAGGAVIDTKNRKVHFKEWGVTLDCEILEVPKPSKVNPRRKGKRTNSHQTTLKTTRQNDQSSHGCDGNRKSALVHISDTANANSHDAKDDVSETKKNSEEKSDRVASVTLAAMNLIGSEANRDLPK